MAWRQTLWRGDAAAGQGFVPIAGVSGALAVALGAYGAHVLRRQENKEFYEVAYKTNNCNVALRSSGRK